MKFKAQLKSENGLAILERGFMPAIDKLGKTCRVLISQQELSFIQTSLDADQLLVTLKISNDLIFDQNHMEIKSKFQNLIGFTVDTRLLLRVLRGLKDNNSYNIKLRLSIKSLMGAGEESLQRPFLSFDAKGLNMCIQQDLPISKPYANQEVEHLQYLNQVQELCPFYLNIQPYLQKVICLVDRLKGIQEKVTAVILKSGIMYLQILAIGVALGIELRDLDVYPQNQKEVPIIMNEEQQQDIEGRYGEAVLQSKETVVKLRLKNLSLALHGCQLTQSAQILLGISEKQDYVHLMAIYADNIGEYDERLSLNIKIPIVEN